jgi:hypothetical protein
MVTIDMPKAREIFRDAIRQARKEGFAAADVLFMQALEAGDTASQQAAVAQKALLRDAPQNPAIDEAESLSALKATWDATLLGPNPFV